MEQRKGVNTLIWKVLSFCIVIVIAITFLFNIVKQLDIPRDDAYISFVYAKNMATGFGPVYNRGEAVEGYTNFLWVILLAGAGALGFDIPTTAQILSIILSVNIILFLFFLTMRVLESNSQKWLAILPSALLVLNPSFIYWTIYSLETNLVLFLLILCLLLFLVRARYEGDSSIIINICCAFCLFLLAITRFDAVLLSGLLGLGFLLSDTYFEKKINMNWVYITTLFFILYIIYFSWRWSFYGDSQFSFSDRSISAYQKTSQRQNTSHCNKLGFHPLCNLSRG